MRSSWASLCILLLCAVFPGCSYFLSPEEKAIEIVKNTNKEFDGEPVSWEKWCIRESLKDNSQDKRSWKSKVTGLDHIYIVSFTDSIGWGAYWECNLQDSVVKYINEDDYLGLKYRILGLDIDELFSISSIRQDCVVFVREQLSQSFLEMLFSSPKYVEYNVYSFSGVLENNSDKIITEVDIRARVKLVFEDKTVEVAEGKADLNEQISRNSPFEPSETRSLNIRTEAIDPVYFKYDPPYVLFEIFMRAEDPIGFEYKRLIWQDEISDRWAIGTE